MCPTVSWFSCCGSLTFPLPNTALRLSSHTLHVHNEGHDTIPDTLQRGSQWCPKDSIDHNGVLSRFLEYAALCLLSNLTKFTEAQAQVWLVNCMEIWKCVLTLVWAQSGILANGWGWNCRIHISRHAHTLNTAYWNFHISYKMKVAKHNVLRRLLDAETAFAKYRRKQFCESENVLALHSYCNMFRIKRYQNIYTGRTVWH